MCKFGVVQTIYDLNKKAVFYFVDHVVNVVHY